MKKWNVAIIGLGFVGKLHYDALRRLPNVHVRTIVVHKAQDIQATKPSMLLGLILGVLWSVLAYGAYMVVAVDGGMSVGYLLMMLLAAYFLTGLTLFGYQQIAMLELPFGTQLKNAALLIFAGKLRAFFAIAVWVGMLLVPVIYYGLAAYILLAGWVAIGVMTANVIFAPVFSRLFLTGEPE